MGQTTRPVASGYSESGASRVRKALRNFIAHSGSPASDIDYNNDVLRERCRMLYMSTPVATSAIDTNRTKIVGTGLVPEVTLDGEMLGLSPEKAAKWEQKAKNEFMIWARKPENCDAMGVSDFFSLEQLALKSWLMSGDCFALIKMEATSSVLRPYRLRIQLIEADRVRTPGEFGSVHGAETEIPPGYEGAGHKVYDGVEVDSGGKVVAYYIHNHYPNDFGITTGERDWVRVEKMGPTGLPNVLHIMESERPGQYRGVPYLAKVIEPILQMRRYTESELMAALIQTFFTIWIELEDPENALPIGNSGVIPDENADDGNMDVTGRERPAQDEYQIGPGNVVHLEKGEKVKFGNPNIPSSGFEAFTKVICRMIGAALEIPYDVLLKEFDSSYSASRGALLEAWSAFKMRRAWFSKAFCAPVWEWFISEAVAIGRLRAPGFWVDPMRHDLWLGCEWIGPTQGQLDPLKEANANAVNVQHGWKTSAQVTQEIGGGSFEANAQQRAYEETLMPTPAPVPGGQPAQRDDDEGGGKHKEE